VMVLAAQAPAVSPPPAVVAALPSAPLTPEPAGHWRCVRSPTTEGPVGYIIGTFGPAAGEEDRGKFVLALRRGADRRWLITADIDNSSRPGPHPPAPSPAGPR
jgi:hypothetical protein